jgi:hypothetical protein
MADLKISQLGSIVTVVPATDVLPVVQGGTTYKITPNQILGSGGPATLASATITGAATVGTTLGVTGASTLASATITGDLTVDTSTLKVDSTNNRVGIGTASPVNPFDVTSTSGTLAVFKRTGSNGAFIGLEDGSGSGLAYLGVTSGTFAIQTPGSGYSDKYTIASDGTATWSVAGTTAMTLNSTGLGIGGSVTNKLTVNNTAATGAVSFLSTGTTTAYNLGQFSNTGGSLYFGVDNSAGSAISGATAYGSVIGSSNSTNLHLITNNTVRATVDTSGNLLVKKTTLSATTLGCELTATGQINGATANLDNLNIYNTTASAYRFFVSAAGTVNATNATITAISDARLKENVQDIDVGLNAILALKPRKFDWKAGKGKDIKGDRGFIAQEFETVFPNLVDEWKDPAPEGEAPYKSVRQDLIPVLVKAIQELTARVQTLEAR